MNIPNVDIVIVTYNRLAKLQYALDCYDKQTMPFRTLIVVDNNSTDGTREFLEAWKLERSNYDRHVIYLPENVGGSGGFYVGEKYALTLNPDWVYISDDDAYPDYDVMQRFYDFQDQRSGEKISVISTSVTFIDRNVILDCRKRIVLNSNQFVLQIVPQTEYRELCFECNCISYVGVFISATALKEVGLVNGEFFIYQDDTEHSIRLSKFGKMYCVPSMIVVHDSVPAIQMKEGDIQKILWKEYYAVRNRLFLLLTHYPSIGKAELMRDIREIKSHRNSTLSPVSKMKLAGIYDALRGKLGIHPFYQPGLILSKDLNKTLPYPKVLWKIVYWILRIQKLFTKK